MELLRGKMESALPPGVELLMAKRRCNPNWGKPQMDGPAISTITEFEKAIHEFKLQPDQYIRSTPLREWARHNKNSKYIPNLFLRRGDSRLNRPYRRTSDPLAH